VNWGSERMSDENVETDTSITIIPDNKKTFSPGELTAVFDRDVQRVYAELGAIWSRYNAFLVAVSLFFAFSTGGGLKEHPYVSIAYALIGVAICASWGINHLHGYKVFDDHVKLAQRFVWREGEKEKNFNQLKGPHKNWIMETSILVIFLFGILFVVSAIWVVAPQNASHESPEQTPAAKTDQQIPAPAK